MATFQGIRVPIFPTRIDYPVDSPRAWFKVPGEPRAFHDLDDVVYAKKGRTEVSRSAVGQELSSARLPPLPCIILRGIGRSGTREALASPRSRSRLNIRAGIIARRAGAMRYIVCHGTYGGRYVEPGFRLFRTAFKAFLCFLPCGLGSVCPQVPSDVPAPKLHV